MLRKKRLFSEFSQGIVNWF